MKSRKKTYSIDPKQLASLDTPIWEWEPFSQFLAREYWRRVWITQELALSQDVVILCGSRQSIWTKFEGVLKAVSEYPATKRGTPMDTKQSSDFNQLQKLQHFCADAKSDKLVHFFTALARTQDSLATEVRDKIFAILGLTYNGSAFVAVPNYRQNIQELCLEITTSAISRSGSLDTIALVELLGRPCGWNKK